MPDEWELQHFDHPTAGQGDIDSDFDGFTNLQEYRANTDPKDPRSVFRVSAIQRQGEDIVLTFPRGANRIHRVLQIPDLATANTSAAPVVLTFTPENAQLQTATVPGGATQPRGFYRVVALP